MRNSTLTQRITQLFLHRDIARLVSSVFNAQMFISGWVHCDPHPANVLLRNNNGKPQMVLVGKFEFFRQHIRSVDTTRNSHQRASSLGQIMASTKRLMMIFGYDTRNYGSL
jgi:predicted unusual protein kinase regulating ubiquinone biosynthesis (AarF/ABC1/UbiB family)